jgi:hypothetical protein
MRSKESIETKRRRILGKTVELAGPHLGFVVIVHDGIIRFKTTVVKILVLVNARIVVIGKVWSYIVQRVKVRVEQVSRTGPRDASPGVLCRHVVPDSIWVHRQWSYSDTEVWQGFLRWADLR